MNRREHQAFVDWLEERAREDRVTTPYKAVSAAFEAGIKFARSEARREALEEAADTAFDSVLLDLGAVKARELQTAIRALIEKGT